MFKYYPRIWPAVALTFGVVAESRRAGALSENSLVWSPSCEGWKRLAEVPALVEVIEAAASRKRTVVVAAAASATRSAEPSAPERACRAAAALCTYADHRSHSQAMRWRPMRSQTRKQPLQSSRHSQAVRLIK